MQVRLLLGRPFIGDLGSGHPACFGSRTTRGFESRISYHVAVPLRTYYSLAVGRTGKPRSERVRLDSEERLAQFRLRARCLPAAQKGLVKCLARVGRAYPHKTHATKLSSGGTEATAGVCKTPTHRVNTEGAIPSRWTN